MSNSSIAIEAVRLSKHLGGRRILREIDLQIASGECVALTGENGAGKTTLLRCLAAITRPTTGGVLWFGRPAAETCTQRQLVGLLAHQSGLYPHLTLRENLLFAARMGRLSKPTELVDQLLEQIGLQHMASQRVQQISKGMRQKLALARALIHHPPIVLLDEPFSGLDQTGRDWLVSFLRDQSAKGSAILFATHDESQWRPLADRTLLLRAGRLVNQPIAATPLAQRETGWCAA